MVEQKRDKKIKINRDLWTDALLMYRIHHSGVTFKDFLSNFKKEMRVFYYGSDDCLKSFTVNISLVFFETPDLIILDQQLLI